MMTKAHVRRLIKQKQDGYASHLLQKKSQAICDRVCALPDYQSAQCLVCYISIGKEVDTQELIEHTLAKGKQVGVPVTRGKGLMDFQTIESLTELRSARLGLLEPVSNPAQRIAPKAIDLIIVPGVAFDRKGHRIGSGGGYYDRYFARTNATRIGLAYAFQIVDHIPIAPHDIQMDYLITEEETIPCHYRSAP